MIGGKKFSSYCHDTLLLFPHVVLIIVQKKPGRWYPTTLWLIVIFIYFDHSVEFGVFVDELRFIIQFKLA